MALLELKIDLSRTADAMERIAVALERAVGPVEVAEEKPHKIRRTEPQDIGRTDVRGERAAMKKLHDLERQMTD